MSDNEEAGPSNLEGEKKGGRKEKRQTYSRAAKPPTARLADDAERITAARRPNRHAKGSQVGRLGHAALD